MRLGADLLVFVLQVQSSHGGKATGTRHSREAENDPLQEARTGSPQGGSNQVSYYCVGVMHCTVI